jgi:hypothetical protein
LQADADSALAIDLPSDEWVAHDGRYMLPEPLLDHRPPRHEGERHSVVKHRKSAAHALMLLP